MKGMSKGIGPKRLGSPNKMGHMGKSVAKIMGRNLADAADKKRAKAEKAEAKGKLKKAERLRDKADKLVTKKLKKEITPFTPPKK